MTDEKQKNRANFPFAAGIVDDLRKVFGPGVKLLYAEENGRSIGKKSEGGVAPVIWHRADEKKKGGRGREY